MSERIDEIESRLREMGGAQPADGTATRPQPALEPPR